MIDWAAIESRNAELGAFTHLDRGASASGAGPLAGVAMGIKANIAVAGLPWTAGIGARRDVVATRDASVVARLRVAGAAILGTLNMHEAALGATTDNPFFGRTVNPRRDGHTPGGSSGGSAAAVAAGLCDAALGTDTLGSVRIPAAYTGVYGLKPTNGLVAEDGLVPASRRFDCIGPLARDLDVLMRVWEVMADAPLADAPPLRRLFILDGLAGVETEPGVRAGFAAALAAAAIAPVTIALPASPGEIRRAAFAEVGRELAAFLGETRHSDGVSDELRAALDAAGGLPLRPDLLADTRALLVDTLGSDGVLMMPTAPQAAFAHGARAPANQADFTCLANIAGLPALALPAGTDESGLPVGVQIVGPARAEARLLAFAGRLDTALRHGA